MTADTNSGYGCGCLALLGIIGLLGLYSLAANRLSCAVGAKQSEAKQYVGSMNRAQQAYFLEKGNFTDNIPELRLGIRTETENYIYSIYTTPLGVVNYSISRKFDLKSYVGGVFSFSGQVEPWNDESGLSVILCEAKSPGTHRPPAPILEDGILQCAPGTESLD
ncbi:type IV pilin-like G/H family protein [Coleofasciculus sp. G2-EDA-02]|uniref:type IV pilin-like G/H family protein n=1 Tax=unclassified Coleofasciculus TaxID=2692782 RepID=UPI0032F317D7